MISKETLDFLSKLKKNNNREWFLKNHERYEAAKAEFSVFTQDQIGELAKINPVYGGLLAKDCVFRIYRDVRFSKNKEPYKLNFGAYICEGGKKSEKPGFYFQIQPGGHSFAAGGCWMPEAHLLKAIRQEIKYHTPEFRKIINEKNFVKTFGGLSGDQLKTVPRGYDKNDPDLDLYRYTSYVVIHKFDDQDVMKMNFHKLNAAVYKTMLPMLDFLKRAIS